MSHMEDQLASLGARVDRVIDGIENSHLARSLRKELRLWHVWMDESRLQVELGKMDAAQRLEAAQKTIDRLRARMMSELTKSADEPLPHLEAALEREFADAKSELASPTAFA